MIVDPNSNSIFISIVNLIANSIDHFILNLSVGQFVYSSIVDSIVDPFANSIDHSIRLLVRSRLFNSSVNSMDNLTAG